MTDYQLKVGTFTIHNSGGKNGMVISTNLPIYIHPSIGSRTGLDWTGLDWTGLDWTGLDWTGLLDWT